jgi:hypothetical protein
MEKVTRTTPATAEERAVVCELAILCRRRRRYTIRRCRN